jgi:hypothetical protein
MKYKNIHNNWCYFCSSLQLLLQQHSLFLLNYSRSRLFLHCRKCYLKKKPLSVILVISMKLEVSVPHIHDFSRDWMEIHVREKKTDVPDYFSEFFSLNFSYSSNCRGKVWSEVPTPTYIHFIRQSEAVYYKHHLKQLYVMRSMSTNMLFSWDRRSRDGMIVGFTTICAISAYHHLGEF